MIAATGTNTFAQATMTNVDGKTGNVEAPAFTKLQVFSYDKQMFLPTTHCFFIDKCPSVNFFALIGDPKLKKLLKNFQKKRRLANTPHARTRTTTFVSL